MAKAAAQPHHVLCTFDISIKMMKQIRFESFDGLLRQFDKLDCYNGWVFRGQADEAWPLRPKVGRSSRLEKRETIILTAWKRDAREHLDHARELNDWEWLALGQHHGLATRLLDWSRNPLTALFFALEERVQVQSAVYALRIGDRALGYSDDLPDSPIDAEGISFFRPGVVTSRISQQRGLFTVHGPPNIDLKRYQLAGVELISMTIPAELRYRFRSALLRLGVDRSTLFPDLDGLAAHLNWISGEMKTHGVAGKFNVSYESVEKGALSLTAGVEPDAQADS